MQPYRSTYLHSKEREIGLVFRVLAAVVSVGTYLDIFRRSFAGTVILVVY